MLRTSVLLCFLLITHFVAAHPVLDAFLNNLDRFQAEFKQQQFGDDGELLETSHGQVYIQRPNRFRWDYQQPYQQLIVADSHHVWIYDIDLEQVTMKSMSKALGRTPALLLSKENTVAQDFDITALPSEGQVVHLELRPKAGQNQFAVIRLLLTADALYGLELQDNLGQTTFIDFVSFERNPSLDADLFFFEPPAGVDVIREKEE